MKILVTGAGGQVAQSLAEPARGQPIEMIARGRQMLDITNPEAIAACMHEVRPDLVINAAAYTAVDKAESEPDLAHLVNAVGAGNLAYAAQAAGIPIIQLSTDYVFDGAKGSPYFETDLPAPVSIYGRTKLAGERTAAKVCPHHLILRTAWVYSPFGHNFVKTMLHLAETRLEIGVVDDQIGSPTYAPHLAEAILQISLGIAERPADEVPWGIYHLAGRGETTWCGLARTIFEHSGLRGGPTAHVKATSTADYPTPAPRPANSRLDAGLMQKTFGVALPEWHGGVAACVAQLLPARTLRHGA